MDINVKDIIVLVPTYNEIKNITIIIQEIFLLFPDINILVIDDNSPDGTAGAVKYMMAKYPNLKIMERKSKTGLGDAYKDGIRYVLKNTTKKAVVTIDADGSHQPKYIGNILENLKRYDLVIASRYIDGGEMENWELWRKKLSSFGNFYSKILIGLDIHDLTAGYIGVKRNILEKINFNEVGASGYAYQIEFKYHCVKMAKASFKEIPILFKSRFEGESKMSRQIISEGIKTPLRLCLKRIKKG